ncbi:hypothetical protein [Streptomyces prasinus]|uniref:hypothetical protein n=2 Tax=Streptomyces TaxID=1883 RepID=UPI002F403F8A
MTGKTSRRYRRGRGGAPESVGRLGAGQAGRLAAQDGVLVPWHEQFRILGGVAARQHRRDGRQPPGHLGQQGHGHADMLSGSNRITPTCTDDFSSVTGINRLKRHRAVATRYDKLAVRYEATVLVAAINEWL